VRHFTLKSTEEEGPDQDFNSLAALSARIQPRHNQSQNHLGWTLIPHPYDDGGFTGSNLERPALKRAARGYREPSRRLLVVYKVVA